MNNAATDRDLLILEPLLYVDPFLSVGQICAGLDGQLSGTTFTSNACDFLSAGVQGGMVLCIRSSDGATEPAVAEILSVVTAHQLSVSQLRDRIDAPAVAPPPAAGASFYLYSYRPQIQAVADRIVESLRRNGQAVDPAALDDSPRFRQAVALGALADIFASRLISGSESDVNAHKATLYRQLFESAAESFHLSADAQSEMSLGNVQLRRS